MRANFNNSVPLSRLQAGQRGRICVPAEGEAIPVRLRDLGFVPGTLLEVRRRAPLGDPVEVELRGYDLFDPATMETEHRAGKDVPAWFLDTDYNGLCFHVSQAFFPRTGAWNKIKKALKASHDETVWDHLAGTVSAPFEVGEYRTVAVKVIDDRGNELIVVKELED